MPSFVAAATISISAMAPLSIVVHAVEIIYEVYDRDHLRRIVHERTFAYAPDGNATPGG